MTTRSASVLRQDFALPRLTLQPYLGIIMRNLLNYMNEIERIVQTIKEQYQPEKIILFGSHVWGAPRKDSDVDLFVVKKSNERRIDRQRAVRKLVWNINVPLDILVYTPEEIKRRLDLEDFFIEDILTKGKVLYSV